MLIELISEFELKRPKPPGRTCTQTNVHVIFCVSTARGCTCTRPPGRTHTKD